MTPTASDLQLVYQRGCIRIIPPGPGKQPQGAARHVAKTKLSEAKNHSWDILVEYIPEKTRGNKNTHTADPSLSTAAPPSCTGRQNRCKQKQMKGTHHPSHWLIGNSLKMFKVLSPKAVCWSTGIPAPLKKAQRRSDPRARPALWTSWGLVVFCRCWEGMMCLSA